MSHVLVICARQYNGHELWTALGVMQQFGHTFEVVSTSIYIEDEVTHQRNVIERTLDSNIYISEGFDGLMIVSGNMADTEAYWTDPRVQAIVKEADACFIPVAAICCSVPTIAPIAKGKKVSYFPLIRSRQRLEDHGAICQTVACTVDGNLVTAEHQMASQMWAEAFSRVLNGETVELGLVDSGYMPKGRERRPDPQLNLAEAALAASKDFYVSAGLTEDAIVRYAQRINQTVRIHLHDRSEECDDECYNYGPLDMLP